MYFLYPIPFLCNGLNTHPILQAPKAWIPKLNLSISVSPSPIHPIPDLLPKSSQFAFRYVGTTSPSFYPSNNSSFYTLIISHLEDCISLFLDWFYYISSHLPIIYFPRSTNNFKSCLSYWNFLKAPTACSNDLQSRVWTFQACKKMILWRVGRKCWNVYLYFVFKNKKEIELNLIYDLTLGVWSSCLESRSDSHASQEWSDESSPTCKSWQGGPTPFLLFSVL